MIAGNTGGTQRGYRSGAGLFDWLVTPRRMERSERRSSLCPVCIATMTLIVAGTTSTGGLTTLVVKKLRAKNSVKKIPPQPKAKEKAL